MALIFVLALNAIFAGYLFMRDPSGQLLGTTTAILRHSPFKDFFIPGLVLFSMNGLLALFTGFLLAKRKKNAPFYLSLQGILLCGWIGIQMLMLRECNTLQLAFAGSGLFFFLSGAYLHGNARKFSE